MQAATLKRLLLFTEGGEWEIVGQLTPSAIDPEDISKWGCSDIPVVEAQNFVLFVPPDKKSVRAMELNEYDNFKSRDLTLFSRHLFTDRTIASVAHAGRYVIAVFTDGTGAICTYDGEAGTPAWTTMDTRLGAMEHVFTLPVHGRERFFFVLTHERTTERYLADFDPDDDSGPYCDHIAGVTADDVVNGYVDLPILHALEDAFGLYGHAGHLLATVHNTLTEDGLPRLALPQHLDLSIPSDIIVGTDYPSYIETLNISRTASQSTFGRRRSVAAAHIQVNETRGLMIGPDADRLEVKQMRQFEPYGNAVAPFSGFFWQAIPREWGHNGRLRIERQGPYRMEILGIVPDVQLGDR